jgi:hypothetical protein
VADEKKQFAQNKAQELKDKIPGEHKDKANEKKEQAREKARELRGRTTVRSRCRFGFASDGGCRTT